MAGMGGLIMCRKEGDLKRERVIYRQITELLTRFVNKDLLLNMAADAIVGLIENEREDSADDKLWDYQCQQQENLLWQSRTTGVPDMFSDELRSFWDNGRPGNV